MKRNTKRFKWRCKSCKDIVVSNPLERHQLDYCKCGLTAVDAEEYYIRIIGEHYEYIGEVD